LRVQLLASPTFSECRFSIPPPPRLSVLDVSLLFMLLSFVWGKGSVRTVAALDYVPRRVGGWVGESCMVHDAHLFVLQIDISSSGARQQREMALLFSVQHGIGRFFVG
jgi:hypothetical protein